MNKYKDLSHDQLAEKMDQADRLIAWIIFNRLGGQLEMTADEMVALNAGRPLKLELQQLGPGVFGPTRLTAVPL